MARRQRRKKHCGPKDSWRERKHRFIPMDLEIYRATTLAEALDYTEHIRIVYDDERWRTYCGKTGNCIYWFLEKAGNAGSTPAKIAKAIGNSRQAVKKYLWRLHSDGLVEKIGRGVYRNFPKEAE